MSFHATKLKQRFLILLLLGITSFQAWSQVADSPLVFASPGGITTSFIEAPALANNATGGGSSSDTKWLKIEFKYTVAPTKGDYLDSVQFKIWVEGLDLLAPNAPGNDGVAVALTGSVTYVNIPKGKDIYGVFYVHPSTLGRYSKQGPTDFERKFNIHLDALIDGKVVDNIDKNKETDLTWYQKLTTTIPGLVYQQNQSPFLLSDPSKYPAIKLPPPPIDSTSTAPPAAAPAQ